MRQIVILSVAAEGKLQNAHSRKAETVTQLLDIRRYYTKVFGNDRQIAKFALQCCKKLFSGNINPTTILGSRVGARNFPRRRKSTKMIDPRDIDHLKRCAKSRDPPAE